MTMQTEQSKNSDVLSWLYRDYESCEKRKALARTFYFATIKHPNGDGDSEKARNNVAVFLQSQFMEFEVKDITIERWSKGFTTIEKVKIPAPILNEKVNWDYIADYFLLAASVPWQEFDEMNEARQRWNQTYKDRIETNKERLKKHSDFVKCLIDEIAKPLNTFDIEAVIVRIRQEKFPVMDKQGNIKEDIKRTNLQKRIFCLEPTPLKEEDEQLPLLPPITLYQSKYFNTPKE